MAVKRDAADIEFSKSVRMRDGGCRVCRKEITECAHIHGRRKKSVRWSMDNAIALCHYHHRYFTEQPVEFVQWCTRELGIGHMEILNEKANQVMKTTKSLRKQIAAHYRSENKKKMADSNYEIVSWN